MNLLKKIKKIISAKKSSSKIDDLSDIIEETAQEDNALIESDEREIIENVLGLRGLSVKDIMIPRADIICASINNSVENIIQTIIKNRLSFLPIYADSLDHILGIIHSKDVLTWLYHEKQTPINQIIQEALFVSPSMLIVDLLVQMRETGVKIAFVVDEFGGIDGLVTFSSLISEVIGDIQDVQASQISHKQIEIKNDGSTIVDGKVTLEEIIQAVGKNDMFLSDDDIDTIGGLVVFLAGHVPVRGEIVKHPLGGEFEILDADPRFIKRLKITYKDQLLPAKTAVF